MRIRLRLLIVCSPATSLSAALFRSTHVLMGGADFGLNATRIHHQWPPDEILVEDRLSPDTMNVLRSNGHKLKAEDFWREGEYIMADLKSGEHLSAIGGRNNGKAVGY